MNDLSPVHDTRALDAYRMSTDAAGACAAIVKKTAVSISGRRHVTVEGWQAIAIAHGCAASSDYVERVNDEGMGGFKAIGMVRRMSDGAEIARAEGFLGDDETMWTKRTVHARRAMVQTRAISRACRSAFAHVVVMIDGGLSTTPAEEMTFDPGTGEIIEAVKEPAAREVLDGPHTSKTALRKAVGDLITNVRKAETIEAVDMLKATNKRTINQALRDWPSLIDGDPNISEDIGLKGAIELRREELTDSLTYQLLVSTLNECESSQELQGWLGKHGDAVEALDGEESRVFTALYEEKETQLKHPRAQSVLEAG